MGKVCEGKKVVNTYCRVMKEKCNLNMLKTDNQVILWLAEMNSIVFFKLLKGKPGLRVLLSL